MFIDKINLWKRDFVSLFILPNKFKIWQVFIKLFKIKFLLFLNLCPKTIAVKIHQNLIDRPKLQYLNVHQILHVRNIIYHLSFDPTRFHYRISFICSFLLLGIANVTQIVKKVINTLMKLILSSLVFDQIRIFVHEFVELSLKFDNRSGLIVISSQKFDEASLDLGEVGYHVHFLKSNLLKY